MGNQRIAMSFTSLFSQITICWRSVLKLVMRTHLFSIFQSCWQNYEHVMVLLKLKRELMTDEVSFRAIIATVKCYNNRFFTILKFHFISFSHWQLRFSKFSKCIPVMPSSQWKVTTNSMSSHFLQNYKESLPLIVYHFPFKWELVIGDIILPNLLH